MPEISAEDLELFEDRLKQIVAHMIVVDPEREASKLLMRIHSEVKSPQYTQMLARGAGRLLVDFLFEEGSTIQMPIALRNLHHLMLTYRICRPVEDDRDLTPEEG